MKRLRNIIFLMGLIAILSMNFFVAFYDLGPKAAYSCNGGCWYDREYCKDPIVGRDFCSPNYASKCDRCLCGY